MANNKKFILDWNQASLGVYGIINREVDGFLLNDADGSFASSPADPYVDYTEDSVIKGRYTLVESRTAWNNGRYTSAIYRQVAIGSFQPVNDTIIGSAEMFIVDDSEVLQDRSFTTPLTESYAPVGSAMTPEQALHMIFSCVGTFGVVGTTLTTDRLDASTAAMTFTLNDATDPDDRTRAT